MRLSGGFGFYFFLVTFFLPAFMLCPRHMLYFLPSPLTKRKDSKGLPPQHNSSVTLTVKSVGYSHHIPWSYDGPDWTRLYAAIKPPIRSPLATEMRHAALFLSNYLHDSLTFISLLNPIIMIHLKFHRSMVTHGLRAIIKPRAMLMTNSEGMREKQSGRNQ